MKSDNVAKEEKALRLLEEYRSGNDKAFDALYHLYADSLLNYGACLTKDRELVKDCVQDVFLRLIIKCKSQCISKIGSYLFVSLRNHILDEFRRRTFYRASSVSDMEAMEMEESREAKIINNDKETESHRNVLSLFDELTARQQEAFRLYFIEERKYDDICKVMKMNSPCVRNLIYRGMVKLRSSETYRRILAAAE